jgi:hypothetical protein
VLTTPCSAGHACQGEGEGEGEGAGAGEGDGQGEGQAAACQPAAQGRPASHTCPVAAGMHVHVHMPRSQALCGRRFCIASGGVRVRGSGRAVACQKRPGRCDCERTCSSMARAPAPFLEEGSGWEWGLGLGWSWGCWG